MNKKSFYYKAIFSVVAILFLSFISYRMISGINLAEIESRGAQLEIFFYNIVFWMFVFACGGFSVFLFRRKKLFLKFAPFAALIFNFLYFSQMRHLLPEDLTGSFTDLFGFISDYRGLFIFYAWFFDYAAWLVVIMLLFSVWAGVYKRVGKLDYLIMPLIFTASSIVYSRPCGGWMCFMSGNGFPLPYFGDGFDWVVFLIDVAVWALIIYPLLKLFIKKGFGQYSQEAAQNADNSLKTKKIPSWKQLIVVVASFFGIEVAIGTIRMIAFNDFTSFRLFNVDNTLIPWIALLAEFVLSIIGVIFALSLYRKKGNFLALATALILGVLFLVILYDIVIYVPLMVAFLFSPSN